MLNMKLLDDIDHLLIDGLNNHKKLFLFVSTLTILLIEPNLSQSTTETPAPDDKKGNGDNFTVIYIVLIIVFAVLVLLVLLCIFYQYHRRGKLEDRYDEQKEGKSGSKNSKNSKSNNKRKNSDNSNKNSNDKSKNKSKKSKNKSNKGKNRNKDDTGNDEVEVDTGGMYDTEEGSDEIPNQIRFRNSVSSVPDNGNTNAKMQLSVTTPRGTTIAADQYTDYQTSRDNVDQMDHVDEEDEYEAENQ